MRGGFSHSEIHGSKNIGLFPWLIAAYHVLHRLSVPRHPPDALLWLVRQSLPREETAPPPRTGPNPVPANLSPRKRGAGTESSRKACPCESRGGDPSRRSRMKTLLEQTPSPGRGPVRLGHIINALFTLQSTPARHSPAPRYRTSPNAAPDPPDRRRCRWWR